MNLSHVQQIETLYEVSVLNIYESSASIIETPTSVQAPSPQTVKSGPEKNKQKAKKSIETPQNQVTLPRAPQNAKPEIRIAPKQELLTISPKIVPTENISALAEATMNEMIVSSSLISDGDSTQKSSAEIFGPAAKRGLVSTVLPAYPEWAQKQGIETEVKLKFWVTPIGKVKEVETIGSSGYYRLNQLAVSTMKNWIFEKLDPRLPQIDQWGEITFFFMLE